MLDTRGQISFTFNYSEVNPDCGTHLILLVFIINNIFQGGKKKSDKNNGRKLSLVENS